jgi:hypothetical protein
MSEHKIREAVREQMLNGSAHQGRPAHTDNPAAMSGLREACLLHAQTLIRAISLPSGVVKIDAAQLFVDHELLAVKVALIFEALERLGVIDGADMVVRLRDKLLDEVKQMVTEAPRIMVPGASG